MGAGGAPVGQLLVCAAMAARRLRLFQRCFAGGVGFGTSWGNMLDSWTNIGDNAANLWLAALKRAWDRAWCMRERTYPRSQMLHERTIAKGRMPGESAENKWNRRVLTRVELLSLVNTTSLIFHRNINVCRASSIEENGKGCSDSTQSLYVTPFRHNLAPSGSTPRV